MIPVGLMFLALASVMTCYLIRHYIFTMIICIYGRDSQRRDSKRRFGDGGWKPLVSVIVPAHNEEKVIGRLLQRITEFTYPKDLLQVIVVDDGSTDGTGEIIDAFAEENKFITSLHRESASGKPAALNEALRFVRGEVVYFLDADYVPDVDFIEISNCAFLDSKVGAVQGNIHVLNLEKRVSKVASLERFAGFRVNQLARTILGLVTQFGGTAGGVRRSLLESIGGFNEEALTEDTDLTFRVYMKGYTVLQSLSACSHEEAVEGWRDYWRQRSRWAKGHMQCAFKYFLPLIKNKNLTFKAKLDGLLLLSIYFVPVLVGLGWLLGGLCLLFGYGMEAVNGVLIITGFYLFFGNVAPLSEVIVGAALEKQLRRCKYIPLLFIAFFLNIFLCIKAFLEILGWRLNGKSHLKWDKTVHNGNS
jgi:cellulose synthase/poly-beta-1,6-N-acetylglucosamine synthase-like glycosyltransferase